MTDRIAQVRSFNRTITQSLGVLSDRFLDRDRPLAEARLLFEIGEAGADVRDLRARLALDSGYLSRLLRSLERQGLARTKSTKADSRVRRATLTRAGRVEMSEINRRADASAKAILAPLSENQQDRLVAAMEEVERLCCASAIAIETAPADAPVARQCLDAYFSELARRFEGGFDPDRGLPVDAADVTAPAGVFLVAVLQGRPVGCGALRAKPNGVGEIKRMWVADSFRGLGIGRRLLAALEDRARAFGLRRVRLDTNRALLEAQSLYRASGYRAVEPFNAEPYAHLWFEKRLH